MYENPNVGNQYMQQIPRYNGMQYQQMQQPVYQNPVQPVQTQQASTPQLIGRTVNSVDEITANDVPMNYPYAIFPKNDLSEVYLKSWTPNGTIQTIVFKPEINPTPSNTNRQESANTKATEEIMRRFDELSDQIKEIGNSIPKPATKTRSVASKKDGESE